MNIGKRLWFLNSASADAGYTYLTQNATAFWDFMVDSDSPVNSVIDQVTGQGTANVNLTKIGADYYPRLNRIQSGYDIKQCASLKCDTNYNNTLIASSFTNLFNASFTIIFTMAFEDFRISSANCAIFGFEDTTGTSNKIIMYNNAGVIKFKMVSNNFGFEWQSDSAILYDGQVGETLFYVQLDAENDTFVFRVNGETIPGTFLVGTVAGFDPSLFSDNGRKFVLGGAMLNGSYLTANTANHYLTRFAVLPIMTPDQEISVISYLISNNQTEEPLTVDQNYALTPLDYDDKAYWFLADDSNNYLESGNNKTLYDKGGLAQFSVNNQNQGASGPVRELGQKARYMMNCKASGSSLNLISAEASPSEIYSNSKCTMFLVSNRDMMFRLQDASGSTTYKDVFIMNFSDGKVYAGVGDGAAVNFGATPVVSDQVRLCTGLYDGALTGNANRMKVRVDGVDQTLTFTGTIPATTPAHNTNMRLGIGILPGNTAIRSEGNFYEGLIFSRLLTETEYENLEYYYFRPMYGIIIAAP